MLRWQLVIGMAVLVALAACKKNEAPQAVDDQAYEPLATMDAPSGAAKSYPADPYASGAYSDDPYGSDPLLDASATPRTAPRATAAPPTAAAPPTPAAREDVIIAADRGQRTHIVQKGDTLYQLARRYYNDAAKWRTIYQANQGKLRSPDTLPVGTKLVIP